MRITHIEKKFLLIIPKCGSSKILHLANRYYQLKRARHNTPQPGLPRTHFANQFQPGHQLIAMIRHPEDRIESLWRMLEERGDGMSWTSTHYDAEMKAAGIPVRPPKGDFNAFVEHVLRVPDWARDMHCRSQYRNCCRDYEVKGTPQDFLPTRLIRWDWREWAEAMMPELPQSVSLPHKPHNSHRAIQNPEWDPDVRRRYREEFIADVQMFEGGLVD